jgi:hypothetical protein
MWVSDIVQLVPDLFQKRKGARGLGRGPKIIAFQGRLLPYFASFRICGMSMQNHRQGAWGARLIFRFSPVRNHA